MLDSPSMVAKPPAKVVWLFAREDESIARELLRMSAVLESQGLVKNWSELSLVPGQSWEREIAERVSSADVVMVLASNNMFDEGRPRPASVDRALNTARSWEDARVVLVLLTSLTLKLRSFAAALQVLPRDGVPIMARNNREEALLDVIRGLQEIVTFRADAEPGAKIQRRSIQPVRAMQISEIFRLDGPPSLTFVEPPLFPELKFELRTMGTGLIVEGPSKVGKSTAIRKAMESLGVGEADQIWWHGQDPPPLDEFRRTLDVIRRATRDTWLFIDDFHHLEDEPYRRALAICMKLLADQPTRHAKVTLIGINPLGSSLVQVMPDLSGRFRVHRLDVEKDWQRSTKIAELIILGERAANVRFTRRDEFVVAAGGSFFLAQWLCNRAAVKAGIETAQPVTMDIELRPSDVLAAIHGELSARFRVPILEFAAFDAGPPPRGAGLSLLWLLLRSPDGFVPLREARLRFPMLSQAFDWFLESNLTRCFQEHPQLKGLLYYNRATTTLTMEDPQLKFYLRELNWEDFAKASGHGPVTFHTDDGPLWPSHYRIEAEEGTFSIVGGEMTFKVDRTMPANVRRLLHLSDLHFASKDQATVSYSQLAADLRQQAVERLDAMVVSGDLVNRADANEYDAARLFLEHVMSGFGLSARQVTLVPGNHDVSWAISESAYSFHKRARYRGPLVPGTYIEHGADAFELRDEDAYRKRFQPFADLYKLIKREEYPLDYAAQGTLDDPHSGLMVLGLNSAWQIDHYFRDRASIQPESLAKALLKLGPPSKTQLRIATFHHPLQSDEESQIKDASFLQQLAVAGFRIVLHGHVHKEGASVYHYDRTVDGRQLEIVAAGTFGAPVREWIPGYPLEYNLFLVGDEKITIETRCRREVNGAWEPYARWLQGRENDPLPRYTIER